MGINQLATDVSDLPNIIYYTQTGTATLLNTVVRAITAGKKVRIRNIIFGGNGAYHGYITAVGVIKIRFSAGGGAPTVINFYPSFPEFSVDANTLTVSSVQLAAGTYTISIMYELLDE